MVIEVESAQTDTSAAAGKLNEAEIVAMAADIVSAYVTRNSMPPSELPAFIASIYAGLGAVVKPAKPAEQPRKEPAVPIKKSVTPDHIICLEDGKRFRTMKRHLQIEYGMTPGEYRAKWGLPADYPMTSPAYSDRRSSMAKAAGLGAARKAAATKKAAKPRAVKVA